MTEFIGKYEDLHQSRSNLHQSHLSPAAIYISHAVIYISHAAIYISASEGRREGPRRRLSLPRLSADSPRYLSSPLAPRLEVHRLGGGSEKFTKFL